jgi:hypothetical protein
VYVLCVEACTPSDDPTGECVGLKEGEYKIIHASGVDKYQPIDEKGKPIGPKKFGRKVIINKNSEVRAPFGFGRIKLWE